MAGKIQVEYDESDIIELILNDLREKMPGRAFKGKDIAIEVISKENYRANTWERGKFRARVETIREWRQ